MPAIVTVLPMVTDAIETGWVAGKLETVTVPVMAAPTVTVTFSSALRLLESNATVTTLATVTVLDSAPEITGADSVTTVGVSVICR